jgi:putative Holliday junction resolvase
MRLLGVDYGRRNIGIAVSDGLGIGARGVTTLRDLPERAAADRIAGLAHELEAEGIVVGLPVGADGSAGEAARKVLRFVERLQTVVSVPVYTSGERLTSFEAEERMREMGLRPEERKRKVDEVAAVIILEEFLAGAARRLVDG